MSFTNPTIYKKSKIKSVAIMPKMLPIKVKSVACFHVFPQISFPNIT